MAFSFLSVGYEFVLFEVDLPLQVGLKKCVSKVVPVSLCHFSLNYSEASPLDYFRLDAEVGVSVPSLM